MLMLRFYAKVGYCETWPEVLFSPLCLRGCWTCRWPLTLSRSRTWSTSSSMWAGTLRAGTWPGSISGRSGTSWTLGEAAARCSLLAPSDSETLTTVVFLFFWLRYGEALFMNSKLIGGVTEFLNTEKELQEVRTFTKQPLSPETESNLVPNEMIRWCDDLRTSRGFSRGWSALPTRRDTFIFLTSACFDFLLRFLCYKNSIFRLPCYKV